MTFDPRSIGKPVYEAFKELRGDRTKDDPLVKKQKSQAVELYTYLSTWGLLRLKAEEIAMKEKKDMKGKLQVIEKFFDCLEKLSERQNLGLDTLKSLDVSDYLGLTGLGLAIAQEFSFWVTAVYHDVKGED
ncbi:MAG: hypothetical protein CV045_13390 [Cyanobacteria bacterium M5B4]|nr:MAG: hypothetical protein CV045_13390 [Cyanobacteria bacterium M5B4]